MLLFPLKMHKSLKKEKPLKYKGQHKDLSTFKPTRNKSYHQLPFQYVDILSQEHQGRALKKAWLVRSPREHLRYVCVKYNATGASLGSRMFWNLYQIWCIMS